MVISKQRQTVKTNTVTMLVESNFMLNNVDVLVDNGFRAMVISNAVERVKEMLDTGSEVINLYCVDNNKNYVSVDRKYGANILNVAIKFYRQRAQRELQKQCEDMLLRLDAKQVAGHTVKVDLLPIVWKILESPLFIRNVNSKC
jgi:uncharacterized protein related to proFAR isomerase